MGCFASASQIEIANHDGRNGAAAAFEHTTIVEGMPQPQNSSVEETKWIKNDG